METHNSEQNEIVIIIPYFGKWPEYFNLFLESCKYNAWLDILFFTDCPIPKQYPKNVSFVHSNLEKINYLIQKKLNLTDYNLSAAYKLCDFKPTYGLLFEEHISQYKYWGFGDIDLIYGDLFASIKEKVALGYDIISAREEIIAGSFTLLKNNNYINNLFFQLENFNQLIRSKDYEGLDETGHNAEIWNGLAKSLLPKFSFTYLIAKEESEGRLKASFETFICEIIKGMEFLEFKENKIYFKAKSLGYFHYVMNKRNIYFSYPKWDLLPSKFYITDTGFYKNKLAIYTISPLKKYAKLFYYYLRKSPAYLGRKISSFTGSLNKI